jgi:hypothetical protein
VDTPGRSITDTAGVLVAAGQLTGLIGGFTLLFEIFLMSRVGWLERSVGATEDAIATVPVGAAPTNNGFPLYNRQLHLTNGAQTGQSPTPMSGGGMLTFIHP